MEKVKLIYLMGAGRSGTTALATLLNGSPEVICLGELHHTPEFAIDDKHCSCGEKLSDCSYWNSYSNELKAFTTDKYKAEQALLESHRSVFKFLNKSYGRNTLSYQAANTALLNVASQQGKITLLDSAKYVGRALALSRNKDIDLRILYMTRDPRGVVNSFSKNVQTPKGTLSACLYYNTINCLALFASKFLFQSNVLKIRYEDLSENRDQMFDNISQFCDIDCDLVKKKLTNNDLFEVGHIIGGNRLKSRGKIRFRADDDWRSKVSRFKGCAVYALTLPFCLLNNYKL